MDTKEIYEKFETEREKSNRSYAVKIVETILFGFIALICVAVIGALLASVVCPKVCVSQSTQITK